MDPNFISEVKITELLEPFQNGKDISVLELFNHVGEIYNKDKNSFIQIVDQITSNLDDSLNSPNTNISNNVSDFSKPFGKYGEITLNEIGNHFQNLQ